VAGPTAAAAGLVDTLPLGSFGSIPAARIFASIVPAARSGRRQCSVCGPGWAQFVNDVRAHGGQVDRTDDPRGVRRGEGAAVRARGSDRRHGPMAPAARAYQVSHCSSGVAWPTGWRRGSVGAAPRLQPRGQRAQRRCERGGARQCQTVLPQAQGHGAPAFWSRMA
jgi:hypothetical protein